MLMSLRLFSPAFNWVDLTTYLPILILSQDSQMRSKLLNQILEENMISLRGGELDTELMEPEEDFKHLPAILHH